MYVFDLESDGLLDEMTVIHCLHLQRVDDKGNPIGPLLTSNDQGCADMTIVEALDILKNADRVVGHNILGFDIPAIQKLHPDFTVKSTLDTLLLSTLMYPDLFQRDMKLRKKKGEDFFPAKFTGRHSLEAWGYRLGEWKGDYAEEMKAKGLDPWARWNREMDDYCEQDVVVTVKVLQTQLKRGMPEQAIELEQAVAVVLRRQMRHGVLFDPAAARALEGKLVTRRAELEKELQRLIPPWEAVKRVFTPKRNNKTRGYIAGVEVTQMETRVFNPRSAAHIAERLSTLYGWKPNEFTPTGQPKVDEDVLKGLKYPLIPTLLEHFVVNKRLSQLVEGKGSWLNYLRKKTNRIHGNVNQNAAVTGRMTHSAPNLAQVPKVGVPYGEECRALFVAPKGKLIVGADASGLELRCLAHFMAKYDDGEYAKVILEGDIHTVNQEAAGLPTRDNAKTFIYGFLYGAGDAKIGTIVNKGRAAGTALRKRFLKQLPALSKLVDGVKNAASKRGYLRGLDGRKLHVRHAHAALNTLLQSAGALIMKQALVILDADLQAAGLVPGVNYEFILNIHDEFQLEVDEDLAEQVGQAAVDAMRKAGEHFNFRCPIDGEYKVGKNWSQTH